MKTHPTEERHTGRHLATRLRKQVADTDRKLRLQVQALEDGVDAELVSARIAELRADRQAAEDALAEIPAVELEAEADDLTDQLRQASARSPAPGHRGVRPGDPLRQGRAPASRLAQLAGRLGKPR